MIIHQCEQGTAEWLEIRSRNFTSSNLGPFAIEPRKINLTVEEIKNNLDDLGIARKGITKRDDLIEMLPNRDFYRELSPGARTAIIGKIREGRKLALKAMDREAMNLEDRIWLERDEEIDAKNDRNFEYNIPVKYGKLLEPFARAFYEGWTGNVVNEVGFIEHDSGGFGCSPDGLIYDAEGKPVSGLEMKCPEPHTHLAWLLDGILPDEHKIQVHTCLAVTGLASWDFLSYCPGEAPLLLTEERSDFTDQLESGLKTLVIEKAKMKARLSRMWRAAYGKEESQ